MAAFRTLAKQGVTPDFAAGHSLGEYSALVAAGGLDFASAVKLVRARGTYMQEAVPPGEGAMAAILGMSPSDVAEVCKKAADGEVLSPANFSRFSRADRDFRRGGGGEARGGNRLAKRRQARGDPARVCAVSLRVDDAGPKTPRSGF